MGPESCPGERRYRPLPSGIPSPCERTSERRKGEATRGSQFSSSWQKLPGQGQLVSPPSDCVLCTGGNWADWVSRSHAPEPGQLAAFLVRRAQPKAHGHEESRGWRGHGDRTDTATWEEKLHEQQDSLCCGLLGLCGLRDRAGQTGPSRFLETGAVQAVDGGQVHSFLSHTFSRVLFPQHSLFLRTELVSGQELVSKEAAFEIISYVRKLRF